MFDELKRMARELERGVRVPIQIPLDDKGYFDLRCPSDECGAEFKVLFADWKEKVRDGAAFCPVCRHAAPATEWNTPPQMKYIKKAATAHVQRKVGDALRRDAERFNRSQRRGGLISMWMSFKPGHSPIAVPPGAAETLRQDFICEACGCRYSSVGAAFFCPVCGHNSAGSTFAMAVQAVQASIATIPAIREAVTAAADSDTAANTVRQIVENGLVKLVAAYQRYAEAIYMALPNASSFPPRRNLFQNLAESSQRWRDATGKGYEDLLTAVELSELGIYFQQRHLLAHKEGIVDQDYIDRSGDRSYTHGQRLVVKESAVLRLADLVDKLGAAIKAL
jgi:uncharacterized Zn finger protein (UPF0148 family)